MRIGSLFTGTGALDRAVQDTLGGTVAWHADDDPAAAKLLAHHWPAIPNHGDITQVDWNHVEPIDVLTAGWPCQPWSSAGQREGEADERALWPEVDRALRALRPRHVVLENVVRIVTAGELARVANSLAACGFRFGWVCLGAAEVGAPHRRNRIFIYATDADPNNVGHHRARGARRGWDQPAHRGHPASDTRGTGLEDLSVEPDRHELPPTQRDGRAPVEWGDYAPAIHRWERVLGRQAPAPTQAGDRGGQQLSPRFAEWMMGLDDGHVTAVPGLTRNQQITLIGNGVCPQQAAAALHYLLALLNSREEAA